MRIKINKENFGDISTAVFYRFSHYPYPAAPGSQPLSTFTNPTEIFKWFSSSKIMLRGSKNELGMESFLEYDFKYEIDKKPYSDIILPNYFSDELLKLVGKDIESLDRISSTIFPTLSPKDPEEYSNKFFGSTMINDKTIYILPAEGLETSLSDLFRGIWKIELYENVLEKNNNIPNAPAFLDYEMMNVLKESVGNIIESPVVTITFGPSSENLNNPSDCYLENDLRRSVEFRNPGEEEEKENESGIYNRLVQEIDCQKALMLSIFPDSSNPEINLSYRSWIISQDPNRNMKKYYLRNDQWYSERDSEDIFTSSTSYPSLLVDSRNGNLVGNVKEDVLQCPILKRKLKGISNNSYSPYREYSLGDKVEYKGETWISLVDHNINSNPFISKTWVKDGWVENIFTNRVNIFTEPSNCGKVIPGGVITIESGDEERVFDIEEEIGYRINPLQPTTPFLGDVKIREEVGEDGKVKRKAIVKNWKNFETGEIIKDLTFNFKEVGVIFYTSLIQGDKILDSSNFNQWGNAVGEISGDVFQNNYYVFTEWEAGPDGGRKKSDEGVFKEIKVDKNAQLFFPALKKFQPDSATVKYWIGEDVIEEKLIPTPQVVGSIGRDNRNYWVFEIYTRFSTAEWKINLVPRQIKMYVDISEKSTRGFEVSSPRGTTVYGSSNYSVEFYPISSNSTVNSITVQMIDYINPTIRSEEKIEEGNSIVLGKDCTISFVFDSDKDLYRVSWSGEITDDYTIILE